MLKSTLSKAKAIKRSLKVVCMQCDEMVNHYDKHLTIYNNENLPKCKTFFPQWEQNFAKY